MGHVIGLTIQRRHESGRWDDFKQVPAILEAISKPDLPPRGGQRFLAAESEGIEPGMRAILLGGVMWDVVKVKPASETGKVLVTLGQGDKDVQPHSPSPAVPPVKSSTPAQVSAVFKDGAGKLVTSIPVLRLGDTITLMHDYPADEFAPQPGWTVSGRGFHLRIAAVEGRNLLGEPTVED